MFGHPNIDHSHLASRDRDRTLLVVGPREVSLRREVEAPVCWDRVYPKQDSRAHQSGFIRYHLAVVLPPKTLHLYSTH